MSSVVTHIPQGMSVIVPFLNEEDGILDFCKTFDSYVSSLDFPIELIFVNDGSNDRSVELLKTFQFQNISLVKLINLSKNYGSHAAIRAGVANCTQDACTWIGCDLQEPLDLIPESFKLLKEGCNAVYIEKKSVKVSKANRFFSKTYSLLMQKYAVKNYSSDGISTIVFDKKIIDHLNQHVESNSSIMLQIIDSGFKTKVISMHFNERSAGVSKWTLSKKIKLLIDSFVSFSFAPIRLVSIIGIGIFFLGIVIGMVTVINKISNPMVPIGYSTLASIVAMGFGVTNISLGIIAEYLWRAYDAARKRPVFIVEQIDELKVKNEE